MTEDAYVPQGYPLFVALNNIELPRNIGELDIYDAKAAIKAALDRRLDTQRVVAWQIVDDAPDPDGLGVFAKPITPRGLGIRWTVAETPNGVRKAMEEHCMEVAGWAPTHVGQGLEPNTWTRNGHEDSYG
jgi:hypothetical protein